MYTVVIPVRYDPLIHRAIGSIGGDAEIVVGLSNPDPMFKELLTRTYGNKIRIACSDKKGMASAMNVAVNASNFEDIIVLDSDCIVGSNETIPAYLSALKQSNFVRGVTKMERNGYWSKIAAKGTESLNIMFKKSPRLFGPSIAFKRSAYLKFGGYDQNMEAGSCDHEFSLRIEKAGETIMFADKALIIHKPLSFKVDVLSHYGYGVGMRYIDSKYGGYYGLFVCISRLFPWIVFKKMFERGIVSGVRSILMGIVLTTGYFFTKSQIK
jgi:glycosyltransferase involved in cell wall biosynthesis